MNNQERYLREAKIIYDRAFNHPEGSQEREKQLKNFMKSNAERFRESLIRLRVAAHVCTHRHQDEICEVRDVFDKIDPWDERFTQEYHEQLAMNVAYYEHMKNRDL